MCLNEKKFYKVIYIMKYRMYLELALVVLLVVLMYQKSHFLNNLVAHPLAKLVLLAGVVAMTHFYGRNAGIISGLIALLLFHNLFEGMESQGDSQEESEESDADESDAEQEGEESEDEQEGEESEGDKEAKAEKIISVTETIVEPTNMKDKTELEDEMRKPKDSNQDVDGVGANPQMADNQQDPFAMPSKTTEGFSLLY